MCDVEGVGLAGANPQKMYSLTLQFLVDNFGLYSIYHSFCLSDRQLYCFRFPLTALCMFSAK